jgi:hypothetical protein
MSVPLSISVPYPVLCVCAQNARRPHDRPGRLIMHFANQCALNNERASLKQCALPCAVCAQNARRQHDRPGRLFVQFVNQRASSQSVCLTLCCVCAER